MTGNTAPKLLTDEQAEVLREMRDELASQCDGRPDADNCITCRVRREVIDAAIALAPPSGDGVEPVGTLIRPDPRTPKGVIGKSPTGATCIIPNENALLLPPGEYPLFTRITTPQSATVDGDAQQAFTTWFCLNYPGPHTIISDPNWHAPRIFRQAQWAIKNTTPPPASQERGDSRICYVCGHRGDEHPIEPHPRGGTRRGKCPASPPSSAAEEVLMTAREIREANAAGAGIELITEAEEQRRTAEQAKPEEDGALEMLASDAKIEAAQALSLRGRITSSTEAAAVAHHGAGENSHHSEPVSNRLGIQPASTPSIWRIPCDPEAGLLEIREPTSLKERMLIRMHEELTDLRRRLAGGVTVDEAMTKRALNAQPFTDSNSAIRVWQLLSVSGGEAPDVMRAALVAALGAK